MEQPLLKVKKLRQDAILPQYGSAFAAGADLCACLTEEKMIVPPHETVFVPTGLAFQIPEGYVGLVAARSGIACKRDLAPANKVGVIDSDYRGEVMVALHNHGNEPREIERGERIAQLLILPYLAVSFACVDELEETDRGDGGFGSTGRK